MMAKVKAAQEAHLSKVAGTDFNLEVVRADLPQKQRGFYVGQLHAAFIA